MQEPSLWMKFLTDLASQGLAALFGAGGGAWLAFAFARRQAAEDRERLEAGEQRKERDREALAGNVAMFTLTRMYNTLLTFFRQRIEPWRTEPLQWYFLPPGGELSLEEIGFDYSALAFLLKGASPSIVLRLDTLADHYWTLADLVKRRSEISAGLRYMRPRYCPNSKRSRSSPGHQRQPSSRTSGRALSPP